VLSTLFKVSSILLLCLPVYAANEIYITQVDTGNNLTLDILQDGNNNEVRLSIAHDYNNIDIDQVGDNNTVSWTSTWGTGLSWGGDLDGSNNNLTFDQYNTVGTDVNKIGLHISSNNNDIHLCQGKSFDSSTDTTCSASSASEYGGHTVNLDIHSGNTDLRGSQETGAGNADHYAQIYTSGGDYNDIFFSQTGDGNKTLNFVVRTDGGEQSMIQSGSGAHTATIDLTGTYKTDLSLTQNSATNQTYTLTNTCLTVAGCSVSVTQN